MQADDTLLTRRGSGSYKWDATGRVFGRDGLLPFWVADMDFATPAPILDAIRHRLEHPVLGYEERSDDYHATVVDWLARRHGWTVPRDWLRYCPPSSVVGICGLILQLTDPGASIAVPTPTYGPLLRLVEDNGRRLIRNPMRESTGRYELDVDGLRASLRDDTQMILLCNPNNPTGRVYRREELEALIVVAAERDLPVICDEVHADLVLPGQRHIPLASFGYERAVSVLSPNKAFNTAGLPQATLVIPDAAIRTRFAGFLDTMQLNHDHSFGSIAMIAAYRDCEAWLDEVIGRIATNHRHAAKRLAESVPAIHVTEAEGTYLAWLDCRALGVDEEALMLRLIERGGVALYAGSEFGEEGRGFLRMNIACPQAQLDAGLDGIACALGA